MRPGPTILVAFTLAVGVHAGVGLWLIGTNGRAGAEGPEASALIVVSGAAATALAEAWRQSPQAATDVPVAELPAVDRVPAPILAATADRSPSRQPAPALQRPKSPAPLPAQPLEIARLPAPVEVPDRLQNPATIERDRVRMPRPARTEPGRTAPTAPLLAHGDKVPTRLPPPELQPAVILADAGTPRPRPRPDTPAAAEPRAAQAPAQVAANQGGNGADGRAMADTSRLQSVWAGAIGARIARAQRHPGRGHGSGRVRLSLVVARDGRLAEVAVATSSGSAALDRAALDAVRRAAPFPSAPKGLPDQWMRFGQWVAFRAN